jgi:DNA-directed RNA polymerase specialized sigma24 family protein
MSEREIPTRISPRAQVAPLPSEAAVRKALSLGDLREAAESTLTLYGPEIFGLMVGLLDRPQAAHDVYLRFAARLWCLGRFDGRCSLRTWCYVLARSEIAIYRAESARSARDQPTSRRGRAAHAFAPGVGSGSLRARTLASCTPDDGIAALRSQLAPEDLEILVLHVDRALSWRDVALVALATLGSTSEEDIERESARLRLRFASIKEQLATAAAAHGITPRSEHRDANIEAADHARVVQLRPRAR